MANVRYIGPERYYAVSDWEAKVGDAAPSSRWDESNNWYVSGLSEEQAAFLTGHLRGLFRRESDFVAVHAGAVASTPRPVDADVVYWLCDAGVTPENAQTGDLVFTAAS